MSGPNRITETSFMGATLYDPTNGAVSGGDIVRSQREGGEAAARPAP